VGDSGDLLTQYPKLTKLYELSPPFHYQPGDATVHSGFMVHGAPGNTTDRGRLNYIFAYAAADTRWWGGTWSNAGTERTPLRDDDYAVVSQSQETWV
jgi:hypothetical protein